MRGTYAVIFSNTRAGVAKTDSGATAYDAMSSEMADLAKTMPGYIDHVSARDESGFGITVSYWESEEAIANWRNQMDHREARKQGRDHWCKDYCVRVARIERAYEWRKGEEAGNVE